ncbi:MAG: hypothetical protein QGG09_17550 [Pirellulaceae bacterium]|jgi:hypothetical protein|nr:hypothetical protein [Pirellulaceae bacterium]
MIPRQWIASLLALALLFGCDAGGQQLADKPQTTGTLPDEGTAEVEIKDPATVEITIVGVYRKPDREFVEETLESLLLKTTNSAEWTFSGSGNSVTFTSSAFGEPNEVANCEPGRTCGSSAGVGAGCRNERRRRRPNWYDV